MKNRNNNQILMKLVSGIVITVFLIISFQYQKPLMTSGEAIAMAVEHLKNPPKQWNAALSADLDLKKIPPEDISLTLSSDGSLNKLMNKMQWNVSIRHNGNMHTISMNAYTGEFIDIHGPLH